MKKADYNHQSQKHNLFWARFFIALILCFLVFFSAKPYPVFAADQILGGTASEGNLRIRVTDTGQMGIERYVSGAWQSQVYSSSPGSKGSKYIGN